MLFKFGLIVLIPSSLDYDCIHLQAGLLYLLSVSPRLRAYLPVSCQPSCPPAYMNRLVQPPDCLSTCLPASFLASTCHLCVRQSFPSWSKVVSYMFFWNWAENQTRLILFSDILTVKESRRMEDRMIWVKTEPERSPISFSKSALFSGFIWHYNMLKPHNRGPTFPLASLTVITS